MNIPEKMLEIGIGVDENRFKSILKKMTLAAPFSIEIGDIAHVDPLDCQTQIRLQGLNQQVVMVAHQTIRMNDYREPFVSLFNVMAQRWNEQDFAIEGRSKGLVVVNYENETVRTLESIILVK